MSKSIRLTSCLVFVSFIFSASIAVADWSQLLNISASDNGFGLPVQASVFLEFDSGTGELAVTLDNLITDQRAINQNLSGLFLTFSTGESNGSLLSSFGMERTVFGDRSYVDGGSVATGWELFDNSVDPLFGTTGVQLNVLGTPTAPEHTILGFPDANDFYGNANASIAGNGPHNPFLATSATFILDIDGLSDSSRISRATFQFNTAAGTYVGVPEPTSLVFLGIGLMGLISCRRRS